MSKEPPKSHRNHPDYGTDRFEDARAEDKDLQRLHDVLLREKTEPTERFMPMPLFLVVVISGLAFWAGIYLIKFSGGFDPFAYDENVGPGQAVAAAGPVEYDPLKAGKRFFTKNCTVCHQASGMGLPGAYPPLVGSEWVQGPKDLVIRIVLLGLQGPMTVEGQQYNNVMTAFGSASDRDLAAVLTYIRTSPEFNNNVEAVTEEDVARVRAEVGNRTEPWHAPDLATQFLGR